MPLNKETKQYLKCLEQFWLQINILYDTELISLLADVTLTKHSFQSFFCTKFYILNCRLNNRFSHMVTHRLNVSLVAYAGGP